MGFVFVYIIVEIIDMVEVIFIVKNVNFNEWYFVGICYLLLKCFIFFWIYIFVKSWLFGSYCIGVWLGNEIVGRI